MSLCKLAVELLEVVEDEKPVFVIALVEEGLVIVLRADIVWSDVVLSLFRVIVRPDEHFLVVDAILAE